MPKEVRLKDELRAKMQEDSYALIAIDEIRNGHYHVARGWLAEAIDARRAGLEAERASRIVNVPMLRTLAAWERCPKRHASEGQHLIDCYEPKLPPEDKTWLDRPVPVPREAFDPDFADRLENRGPLRA